MCTYILPVIIIIIIIITESLIMLINKFTNDREQEQSELADIYNSDTLAYQ